jgi:hypothetical protein
MPCDRFVWFDGDEPMPPKKDLYKVVVDYLGEVLQSVSFDGHCCAWHPKCRRWYLQLEGNNSWPLRRLGWEPGEPRAVVAALDAEEPRVIEIYIADNNIDIMTRRGDMFVNDVASALARLCAGYWKGRLEDG